jgi:hypothetical protein
MSCQFGADGKEESIGESALGTISISYDKTRREKHTAMSGAVDRDALVVLLHTKDAEAGNLHHSTLLQLLDDVS